MDLIKLNNFRELLGPKTYLVIGLIIFIVIISMVFKTFKNRKQTTEIEFSIKGCLKCPIDLSQIEIVQSNTKKATVTHADGSTEKKYYCELKIPYYHMGNRYILIGGFPTTKRWLENEFMKQKESFIYIKENEHQSGFIDLRFLKTEDILLIPIETNEWFRKKVGY